MPLLVGFAGDGLSKKGRVCPDEGLAATKLIVTDEENARRQIVDMRDRQPKYRAGLPPPSFWRVLWRIRRACGCDLPRDVVLPEDQAAALERARIATAPLADARAILDRQVNAQWEARRAAAREKPVNPAAGEE